MKKFLTILYKYLLAKFKKNEKTVFLAIFLLLSFFIIKMLSDFYTISIPKNGGVLNEISINNEPIKYINPVLASNQAEKDLSSLIFSSLMKVDTDGQMVKNIAEYDLSDDGLTYTLSLDRGIYFHDGVEMTADDIIFTIELIQNISIESPLYPSWLNVQTEKIDKYNLKLVLEKPYALFSNFFDLGILPKHLLQDFNHKELRENIFNLKPIGSGPYTLKNIKSSPSENTFFLEKITSKSNSQKTPFIKNIIYHSFYKLNALEKSSLYNSSLKIKNISSIYPSNIPLKEYSIERIIIPKINFLFLNIDDKNNFLTDRKVRKAISKAISKEDIVDTALESNALIANSFRPWSDEESFPEERDTVISEANKTMKDAGYKKNNEDFFEKDGKIATLEITIIDSYEFETVAKIIAKNLSKIGIKVIIKKDKLADYENNIIAQKDFQATIFGYDTYLNPDVYFLLSSEFENPINISNYISPKANLLSKKIRIEKDLEKRNNYFSDLEKQVFENDIPMVPLYSPNFTYLTSKKLNFISPTVLNNKESRFENVEDWYIETEKILPFFKNNF